MGRKIVFFVMIVVGLGAGLLYGWMLKPAATSDNPLSALRQDYKSDYVLMVAEIYHKDGDLGLATERLNQLDGGSAIQTASDAMVYARQAGYSIDDLELITLLIQDLQGNAEPTPVLIETPTAGGA
jgi:hypothetical protein